MLRRLMPMTGTFITFEGVEGAGKSTQIPLLETSLARLGYRVHVTREPGGEPVAEALRSVLLNPDHAVTPAGELLMFLAARAQVTANVIRPRLADGEIVLCDRFTDSTVAYQGYGRGFDLELIGRLNALATGGLTPDLTILLDIDSESGMGRQREHNRMEGESMEFHRAVRQGFLAEARKEPSRIRIVDSTQSVDSVQAEILAAALSLLRRATQ